MALGGVDTGRNSAVEDANPIISAISNLEELRIAMPNGIKTVLAAVWLITLEAAIETYAKMKIKARGGKDMEEIILA